MLQRVLKKNNITHFGMKINDNNIELFKDWDYQNKDAKIYGYVGERYLKGRDNTKELYCWYQKYGFIENPHLNTHCKYFGMTPLPAMELNLSNYKLKKLCMVFLDNKYLIEPKLYREFTDYSEEIKNASRNQAICHCHKYVPYIHDICRVKLEDGLTNSFLANQGVKQGCILSPLLFNIFLADLPQCISGGECNPVKIHGVTRVRSIIWADDIILLSESETGLQSMLDSLSQYTKENGMQINVDKTKVIIFNKTGRFFRRSFYFVDTNLFSTNSDKYLGFIVTPSVKSYQG